MPSPQTVIAITLAGSILGGIAAALFIYEWVRKRAKAVREDVTTPVLRWPKITLTLVVFAVLCSAVGLWFLFHLPKPAPCPTPPPAKECPVVVPPKAATVTKPEPAHKIPTSPVAQGGSQTGNSNAQGNVGGNVDMSGDGCQQKIIGGSNNTNNCEPPKYKPDNLACTSFSTLAKYKGRTVAIVGVFQFQGDNGHEFQSALGDCLSSEGLTLIDPVFKKPNAHASSNFGGFNVAPTGITISYSPDMESMAEDLRSSILNSKAVGEKELSIRTLEDGYRALAIAIAPRSR